MKIYTKTGDGGETSLFNGNRVKKYDLRIELLGSLDELNSYYGLIISEIKKCDFENQRILESELELIEEFQSLLFDIGSVIANPDSFKSSFYKEKSKVITSRLFDITKKLEKEIDLMTGKLDLIKNFILPGGSSISSFVHITRAVCRRIERGFVEFRDSKAKLDEREGSFYSESIIYLNRSSDYLFQFARYLNKILGYEDVIWVPK